MLLTLTSTSPPATDLGFLLHKNPASVRSVAMTWGTAHVFYPVAEADRCTAALLCEVDPVALVRRSRGGPFPLAAYVNDRPYAASSLLAVALRKVFGTAMSGTCTERPDLPAARLELSAHLPVLPCRGGEELLRRVLEPLGYTVSASAVPLDAAFPGWGDSPYFDVRISAVCRVRDLLGQLYVLLPVLDDDKHYWVGADEVTKLLRRGGQWLASHPDHELIARRYLRHDQRLTRDALAMLFADEAGDPDRSDEENDAREQAAERQPGQPAPLNDQRLAAVLGVITASGARSVLDLGCGSGQLLAELVKQGGLQRIVGLDVSCRALELAGRPGR